MSSPNFPVLNPNTPMAFLPPEAAAQTTAARYVESIVLGAWFWDFFMSIPEETLIYRRRAFKVADFIYFMSRIASGGTVVAVFLFCAVDLPNCQAAAQIAAWFAAFAIPLNASLFLLRVFGIFYDMDYIRAAFTLLWIGTLGSFAGPFALVGKNVGPTNQCIIHSIEWSASTGPFASIFYDTIVFLAISIRLLLDNPADGWVAKAKVFISIEKMGHLSQALLQTGQVYYLVAAGGNFAILAVVLNHRIPVAIRAVLTVPNVALQNAIACRVFRHLRLGYIKRSPDRFRSSASVTPNVNHPINFMSPSSLATLNVSISGPTDDTYPPQHSAAICDNQGSSLGGVRREQGNKPDPFSSGQSADSRV